MSQGDDDNYRDTTGRSEVWTIGVKTAMILKRVAVQCCLSEAEFQTRPSQPIMAKSALL